MNFQWIFRTIFFVFCINSIHTQYAQTLKTEEICTGNMLTMSCSVGYVPVVRKARFGVSQVVGNCRYTPTDCSKDAMDIVYCTNHQNECHVFASRVQLPECGNQQSTYLHVEYDCIPISMGDPSKVYNICNYPTQITSDHGIIQSPGYPTSFQITPLACPLHIRIAEYQQIRFWLTDLAIGSTQNQCTNDFISITGDMESFQHCGSRTFSYPDLCSSNYLIEYKASTNLALYRGMELYFEISNRTTTNDCPRNSLPPSTPQTQTTSTFTSSDVALPIRSFQLCAGESANIQCPDNYTVSMIKNVYGLSQTNSCEPYNPLIHCTLDMISISNCRQQCTIFYSGNQNMITCQNQNAHYRYIEYRCIPVNTPVITPTRSCSTNGSAVPVNIDRQGRFQNLNYPINENMSCRYRLTATPGEIINIYSLDIHLNNHLPPCSSNQMILREDGHEQGVHFCNERNSRLIYRSCSDRMDLFYFVNETNNLISGIDLYIETEPRPVLWSCNPMGSLIGAAEEIEYGICFGQHLTAVCSTGEIFMIVQAIYGVKQNVSNTCSYTPGDCIQNVTSTFSQCTTNNSTCHIMYATQRRLAACNNAEADYLHITGQCIPNESIIGGETIDTHDICDSNSSISSFSGFITSPGFPNYITTNRECRRKINVMRDRLLKIWISELSIATTIQQDENIDMADLIIVKTETVESDIRGACPDDYLIIDTHDTVYVYCGRRKLVLPPICSSDITIQYRTSALNDISYRGFKIYFEWVDRPLDFICPDMFNSLSTSTPSNIPLPVWAQNLEVSPIMSVQVCLGNSLILRCPRENDYLLSIISSIYGVTGTGSCRPASSLDCSESVVLGSCGTPCLISYETEKNLSSCRNQTADYLNIQYECIPKRLPNNQRPIDICAPHNSQSIVNGTNLMVQSPGYPVLDGAYRCSNRFETLTNHLWVVYNIDLFLEKRNALYQCANSALHLGDGQIDMSYCGLESAQLLLYSCSNVIEIDFHSDENAVGYRGFQFYLKSIEKPDQWDCTPNFPSTTTSTSTTVVTSSARPTSTAFPSNVQILTFGGTTNSSIKQYCHFPFVYQGIQSSTCLKTTPPNGNLSTGPVIPWCSLTDNFDSDGRWGFCDLGVTDAAIYTLCPFETQLIQCPAGHLINFQESFQGVNLNQTVNDNTTCTFDRRHCLMNDFIYYDLCNGRQSCNVESKPFHTVHCGNQSTQYLHLNYTCVPQNLSHIPTYEFCRHTSISQVDSHRGFIISPNYPQQITNFTCSLNIFRTDPSDDIYIYVLDMKLTERSFTGNGCGTDRLSIDDSTLPTKRCGNTSTRPLYDTCLDTLNLELMRLSNATGHGVKLYFEFRKRVIMQHCRPWLTTSTSLPNSSIGTSTASKSSSSSSSLSSAAASAAASAASSSASSVTSSTTRRETSSSTTTKSSINTTKPNIMSSISSIQTNTSSVKTTISTSPRNPLSTTTTKQIIVSGSSNTTSLTSTTSIGLRQFQIDSILIPFNFIFFTLISSVIIDF